MTSHGLYLNSTNSTYFYFDYFCTSMLTASVIWGFFSVVCACVGMPASVWLLWVLVQRQRSGSTNNIYMLSLTAIDLVFNLCLLPGVLNYFVWRNVIYLLVNSFFYIFIMSGRPLFVSCVCIDSYLAVVHPVTYMKIKDGRYRLFVCALVWVFSFVLNSLFFTPLTSVSRIAPLGISIPIIVLCDVSIIYALRKPDPSGNRRVHPQKQRAIETIINSLVVSLLSHPPLLILHVISVNQTQELYCSALLVYIMATLGSTIMPLIHLHNVGKLKCIDFLCCRRNKGDVARLRQTSQ